MQILRGLVNFREKLISYEKYKPSPLGLFDDHFLNGKTYQTW